MTDGGGANQPAMFPELNGAQMGALSHFVQDALVRKLVDKGLLSGSDVLAIMGDAASNLGRFGQSDARAALGALENKIIPAAQQRAQVRAREAATPSKSKGTVRNGIATVTFWLFIVLAAISIV